ncbi:MAG: exodeoxyribonuclease I, partial [Gammaproteobacteria bacterium]|nr:exodeoxyribonuclease I [Gammaproteobacteria bacterium]
RTDENLEIIGEPLMIYSQPTADFVPHPEAVLITGITPQHALSEGVVEAEFFRQIHTEFSKAGTCIVGYNSIRFDDEVTRFGFYRNFIDPYAYSWQNSNSRWDVLDLMRLTHALRPEGINWPLNDAGVVSFKLTDLTAANNIEQTGAHDALVDVKATIAIAKLVKQQQPRLFEFYFDLRNKQRVAELINLAKPQALLHVSGMFPVQQGCLAPIVPLLAHPTNSNEIICYNLRFNPQQFLQLSAEEIQQKLYTRTLDLAEGEERIPLKGVHLNKSPALAPVNTLTTAQAEKWQVNWDDINTHYEMLMADPDLITRLSEVYKQAREFEETDADSALYEGFISRDDRLRCNQLLAASPEDLVNWTADDFQDSRLQTLLFRYRARNYPDTLLESEKKQWDEFRHKRLSAPENSSILSQKEYLMIIDELKKDESTTEEQQKILDELLKYPSHLT